MIKKKWLNYQTINPLFLAGSFLFFLFIFSCSSAQAELELRGKGWWEGNGYVFFNCKDDQIGDYLDAAGNLNSLPAPRGFHFYVPPCGGSQHKVVIDNNNNFTGSAWNKNKGVISFQGTTTMPLDTSYQSNCQNTCDETNHCWACYNEETQKVYGWAQAEDGTWIKLDSDYFQPNDQVYLQGCGNLIPGHTGLNSGDFVGTASSSAGFLSFNCLSEPGGESCAEPDRTNYKVYVGNLGILSMSAPNYTYSEACSSGYARGGSLKWCAMGAQKGYQIIINDDNSTSTPVFCDTGYVTTPLNSFDLKNNTCADLAYGTNYYWWIRLKDNDEVWTSWYQYYGNSSSTDTDLDIDHNIYTFTTFKHEFPSPFFSWSPFEILVGTSTLFTGTSSEYYSDSSPSSSLLCSGINCGYTWSTTDNLALISSTTAATTSIIFNKATNTTITLKVTDLSGYYCSISTTSSINYGLPIWREIKAQ